MASAVCYGASAFALGGYAAHTGWLVASLVSYGSSLTAMVLVLPFRPGPAMIVRGSGMAWAVSAGVTEAAALAALASGGQAGQVAVTGAVSSLYPVLPLVVGLVVYRERLSLRQAVGVAFVIAGLAVMGANHVG